MHEIIRALRMKGYIFLKHMIRKRINDFYLV